MKLCIKLPLYITLLCRIHKLEGCLTECVLTWKHLVIMSLRCVINKGTFDYVYFKKYLGDIKITIPEKVKRETELRVRGKIKQKN